MEKERRKYERLKDDFNIKIDFVEEWENVNFNIGKSVDISGAGIHFTWDKTISLNTVVEVKFIKPNSFDFLIAKAKVAWCKPCKNYEKKYDIGLEFLDLTEEQRKDLDYYLHKK